MNKGNENQELSTATTEKLAAPETGDGQSGLVAYPGIIDQKTLAACLQTVEQVIRDGGEGISRAAKVQRFQQTKAKLIAQVKAHPLSFNEWNKRAATQPSASGVSPAPLSVDTVESSVQHEPKCVKCGHELMSECPLDDLGRCQVRIAISVEDADSCGCTCVFPEPKSSELVSTDIERLCREAARRIYDNAISEIDNVCLADRDYIAQIIQSVFNGYQLIPEDENQDAGK